MDVDLSVADNPIVMRGLKAAQDILSQPRIGSFLTSVDLMSLIGKETRNHMRMTYDLASPGLFFRDSAVYLDVPGPDGTGVCLFKMDTPLIAQLIHLKPFICPENFAFFIDWVRELHGYASDSLGRKIMFGASDDAEMWFQQNNIAPTIDSDNPLPGLLQTMKTLPNPDDVNMSNQ